jgi:hypothetical protein
VAISLLDDRARTILTEHVVDDVDDLAPFGAG